MAQTKYIIKYNISTLKMVALSSIVEDGTNSKQEITVETLFEYYLYSSLWVRDLWMETI